MADTSADRLSGRYERLIAELETALQARHDAERALAAARRDNALFSSELEILSQERQEAGIQPSHLRSLAETLSQQFKTLARNYALLARSNESLRLQLDAAMAAQLELQRKLAEIRKDQE